jgi:hypothetical protein
MTTPTDAMRAALARIEGDFDHPTLKRFWPLEPCTTTDVKRILRIGLAAAEGPRVVRYRARHSAFWLAKRGDSGGLGLGYHWSGDQQDAHHFPNVQQALDIIDLILPAIPMGQHSKLSVELAAAP